MNYQTTKEERRMNKKEIKHEVEKLYEQIGNLEVWIPETENCLVGASKINGQEQMRLEVLKLIKEFYHKSVKSEEKEE